MTNNEELPTLKDMVASVMQQGEEEAKTAAATPPADATPAAEQAQTSAAEEGIGKISSAAALAFADQLEAAGADSAPPTAAAGQQKQASAMQSVLDKLSAGAGPTAPQYAPEAETNLGTTLKPSEPKKDKAKTVPAVSESPTESLGGPPKLQTNAEQDTPGKTPDTLLKASQARQEKISALKGSILSKLAGEDVSPASISPATQAKNPEDEAAPAQPQGGDRSMIGSSAAATNYTKGQAKATPKRMMGQVLDEPALSRATDSKLHENLKNTQAAGVKISSAQRERAVEVLRKVASRPGTEQYAWLAEQVHQIREKRAAAQTNDEAVKEAMRRRSFLGTSA